MKVEAQLHRNGDKGTGMVLDLQRQRDSGEGEEVS